CLLQNCRKCSLVDFPQFGDLARDQILNSQFAATNDANFCEDETVRITEFEQYLDILTICGKKDLSLMLSEEDCIVRSIELIEVHCCTERMFGTPSEATFCK